MFESSQPQNSGSHLKFRRLKLEPGKSYKGWKAGPAIGVPCHFFGRTKPCIRKITNGNLPCPCEVQKVKEGWVGYLPFFNEHGMKMVALFGRESHESVDRMPFGSPIKISKGNWPAAPVYIVVDSWTTAPCPWIKPLKAELEIRPWLLNLWKIEELTEYFKNDPVIPRPIKTEGLPKKELFENPPPLPKLASIFEQTAVPGLVNRISDSPANGVHPKSKKKK